MLPQIKQFFKAHSTNILLFIVVLLLCLLSFGAGMLAQFYLEKPPLEIEQPAGLPAEVSTQAGE